jgi:phosphatidylserine/phosphatidylglycerophosphate/cardiolipin synthase-like enzyme
VTVRLPSHAQGGAPNPPATRGIRRAISERLLAPSIRKAGRNLGLGRPVLAFVIPLLLAPTLGHALALELHYAPNENLEAIDEALIDDSAETIDIAAYVLSDQTVIAALIAAADRGVLIRLYLDKGEFAEHDGRKGGLIEKLLSYPNVFARLKGRGVLMHLKAYVVDGRWLRTGSGNFSRPGLTDQDNDLIVVDDVSAIARFESNFDAIFARGTNIDALQRPAGGSR